MKSFITRMKYIMNLINRIGEELGFDFNFVKVGLLLACFLVAIADLSIIGENTPTSTSGG